MGHLTLEEIIQRVEQKKNDYKTYNFERLKEEAFATFFDLAQELTSLEHLYLVSVAVPKVFFGFESEIYVINPKSKKLEAVCSSKDGLIGGKEKPDLSTNDACILLESIINQTTEDGAGVKQEPYRMGGKWVFLVRSNRALTQWVSFSGIKGILGLFVTSFPESNKSFTRDEIEEDLFFLEKFTNRVGYNLHQKLLIQQNLDHIKFINQLVADIEHNVISPNLYYKLYIKRLNKSLQLYRDLQKRIKSLIIFSQEQAQQAITQELCSIYYDLSEANDAIEEEAKSLEKHYTHTSLFLETLFRKEHFVQGTYVLRKQPCNFKQEIVEPLLERYKPMFEKKNIIVRRTTDDVPDENLNLFVDKGLISQVFDNLLSNALKYTEEVEDPLGNKVKLISLDRKILKKFFGDRIHGIKLSLFSTGKPLSEEESQKVFEEGYRVNREEGFSPRPKESGMGHGLYFVRSVIEIHGGIVGCEPDKYGNAFFFILPFDEEATSG